MSQPHGGGRWEGEGLTSAGEGEGLTSVSEGEGLTPVSDVKDSAKRWAMPLDGDMPKPKTSSTIQAGTGPPRPIASHMKHDL